MRALPTSLSMVCWHHIVLHPWLPKTTNLTTSSSSSDSHKYQVVFNPAHEPLIISNADRYEDWREAIKVEIQVLCSNSTWFVVSFHHSMNVLVAIGCTRSSVVLMVALNAMRLSWLQKVLVSKKVLITLSRVVKQATVQLIFTVVVLRGWKINQLDIHNVFLNKTLNKEVYMQQPPGFVDSNHSFYVWWLHKSLYGLK